MERCTSLSPIALQTFCWYFVLYMNEGCAKWSLSCRKMESQSQKTLTHMPCFQYPVLQPPDTIWFEAQLHSRRWRLLSQFSFGFFIPSTERLLLLLLLVLLLLLHDGGAIGSCKGIFGMKRLMPLACKGKWDTDRVDKGEIGPHNRMPYRNECGNPVDGAPQKETVAFHEGATPTGFGLSKQSGRLRSSNPKITHKKKAKQWRKCHSMQPHCLIGSSQKRRAVQTLRHHHVVSLAVSVMCLMLKYMETSKVQIQIKNWIWSACLGILFMFTVCGHIVAHFDMVAELARIKVHKIRRIIRTLMKTIITSSSGETKKFKWDYHLKEGADVNMFAHDHRVPCVPQPTSFDGIQPSFLEWSEEEVIAYLAVTDYQEFIIPLLSAAAASKMSLRKTLCSKGSCQRTWRQLTKSLRIRSRKSKTERKLKQRTKLRRFKISQKRSRRFKENFRTSKQNWSRRNQLCSRRISFSGIPCFMRHQVTQMSWSGGAWERQIQIQAQSLDWNLATNINSFCGFSENANSVTPQADQVTCGVECREVKGRQFSNTITGWNSSQSMERSGQRRSQTLSRSPLLFRMSKGNLLSLSMSILVIPQHGLKFMHFWSTTSTMQFR